MRCSRSLRSRAPHLQARWPQRSTAPGRARDRARSPGEFPRVRGVTARAAASAVVTAVVARASADLALSCAIYDLCVRLVRPAYVVAELSLRPWQAYKEIEPRASVPAGRRRDEARAGPDCRFLPCWRSPRRNGCRDGPIHERLCRHRQDAPAVRASTEAERPSKTLGPRISGTRIYSAIARPISRRLAPRASSPRISRSIETVASAPSSLATRD